MQTPQDTLKTTSTEADIILHMLDAPDAIADALTDHADNESPAVEQSYDAVIFIATNMAEECRKTGCIWIHNAIRKAILEDACDGSTFFANCDDWDKNEYSTYARAATRLEKKLLTQFKLHIAIPRR